MEKFSIHDAGDSLATLQQQLLRTPEDGRLNVSTLSPRSRAEGKNSFKNETNVDLKIKETLFSISLKNII